MILGIVGGGQLAYMMIPYCRRLGIETWVVDRAGSPAQAICDRFFEGSIHDKKVILEMSRGVDVVTIEIDQVDRSALAEIEKQGHAHVAPSASLVKVIQDKGVQKKFFTDLAIPTAEFRLVEQASDLSGYQDFLPAVLKTREGGYDGKGVMVLNSIEDLPKAFDQPCVLEKKVSIAKELATIVARNRHGDIKVYPLVEMVFDKKLNLLDYLSCPADVPEAIAKQSEEWACRLAEQLELEGLLAVELFVTHEGELLVNEISPRPHNSGHHTIEAIATSQFEQHVRAVCGLPLGDVSLRSPAVMVNLVGEGETGPAKVHGLEDLLREPQTYFHWYGKSESRPGRKMGHYTVLGDSVPEAKAKMERVRPCLKVTNR